MTAEQWLVVKEEFEKTRLLPPELRRHAISEIGDEEVRREVEELVKAFDSSQEFLEQPAFVNGLTSMAPSHCGERLGNYLLVRQIGEGGMGVVYEAQRADGEFEQRVAVKLVRRSLIGTREVERFRSERRVLAKLDHPNIARLIDGGTTADGSPFLVMEFVEGVSVETYCNQHSLGARARLELFVQICQTVAYAHEQGIVHRDIKPANILVTAAGKPKLLDFGIAKISQAGDSATATATQFRLATPQYASPEQLRGEPTTPASDIYSLGVLLYELLTQKTPSVSKDEEFERPSNVTRNRSWRRTLDLIVLKCLQQHPAARYASVPDLTADVVRYLNGRKVLAKPKDRTTKLALLIAGAAIVGALGTVVFTRVSVWNGKSGGDRLTPKTLAVLPFHSLGSRANSDYLGLGLADAVITRLSNISELAVRPTSSVLNYANSEPDLRVAGRNLRVDAIVEGSVQETGDRLRLTVQLVRVSDGSSLWAETFNENTADLFTIEDSISQEIVQKLALRLAVKEREELGRRPTVDAEAYRDYLQGRYSEFRFTRQGLDQAIKYFNQAIARDSKYALAYAGLADAYTTASDWVLRPREGLPKAESASRRALELDDNLAEAHASLAHALMHEWRLTESGAEFRRALSSNPNNTSIFFAYSEYLSALGREDDAVAQLHKALEIDPQSVEITSFIGWPLYLKQDYQSALAAEDRAIRMDPNFWTARMMRAYILRGLGRYPEAIAEFQKALDLNPDSSITLSGLGAAYADAGQRQEAVRVLARLKSKSVQQYVSPMDIGFVEAALGNRDEAIEEFREGYKDGSEMLLFSQVYGRFYAIGKDPRFQQLVRQVSRGWS
ncbi:MAG: protein kinase [Acidobacteriaceae bacterium]|nr:protein kinase [Acidobacteriaceae bacterium]MBV9295283.1 protein kinase [Acidobacteriaceae bacterium]